jgi:glucose dehydrogenase
MSNKASTIGLRRSAVAGAALVAAAGLIAAGCSSSSSSPSTSACSSKPGTAVTGTAPAGTGRPAAGWTEPGADLANTRDVASAITSADVSELGVAWTVPLTISTARTDGAYATTPVVVNGVVYVQDLDSDVMAISLATGKVLWTHDYNSPNGGPDGVTVANPGPLFGSKNYPLGSSRPGPDLYTDSVVKLSPAGKLLWYYQLTPHDLYDWDLQDPPVLSTADGRPVVIDGGKAGILIELDAQTGKLLWKLPVGAHDGHENDGLLTEHATSTSRGLLPAKFCLEPSIFGGVETQLASNGSTTFAAVNDLALPATPAGYAEPVADVFAAVTKATGEMVAVNQDSGTVEWDTPLPSSPYGAATVTNDVVLTTTFHGDLYALDAPTGAILFQTPMSAGSNAPVAVAGAALSSTQRDMIIAYKLGATGKLPDTVGA